MSLKKIATVVFLIGILYSSVHAQPICIGVHNTIESSVLEDTRRYSVYLPPSYGENYLKKYPVLYLMDGDYNFRYVTGLVEQLSSVSGKIPEMIVVGLSDNGRSEYVNDCTPRNKKLSPEGRSDLYGAFLNNELKPLMDSLYLTSPCDFLVGQSIGGLFVVNTFLENPDYFQNYIAISPSVWWNDYKAKEQIPDFYEAHENLEISLYLTLANEKGMGVLGFADALDVGEFADIYLQKRPLGLDYQFKQYKDENHNSVGLVSISDGIKRVFEGYEIAEEDWAKVNGFEEYIAHIAPLQKKIGEGFTIPETYLSIFAKEAIENGPEAIGAIQEFIDESIPASSAAFQRLLGEVYLGNDKPGEAILALRISINTNPNNPKSYTLMGKCFQEKNDPQKAKHYFQQALDKAYDLDARTWYINQLEADLRSVQ